MVNTDFINVDMLERLYLSYGFEVDNSEKNLRIFIYRKSRYMGVDVIGLNNENITNELAESKRREYSELGYAVNLKKITTNEEAEIELFKSFFSYETSRERLRRKYIDFAKNQSKQLLGFKYQYIESPYDVFPKNEDLGIFETINKNLNSQSPELIIIEAAAGYGKTCTAYELLNKMVSQENDVIPIFTELSRNRGANIFRYVLLDEIDLEFQSLNSPLVIKEIKNGRVPLIIDGFDELLEKVQTENLLDKSFEEVESMLDTIGNLLEHRAKIILTTRKTAIFTGIEFDKWVVKWENKFRITRLALKEPKLKEWLGNERYQLIKDFNTPIHSLANPVLLTFLKHSEEEYFIELITNSERLIEQYFERLLEREKERQTLYITVENQMLLFYNVAKNLLEMDATAEEKDFFKLIILEDNRKLLDETLLLYSGVNRPNIDNLVDTLATHALLDRKGRNQDQIGFVNDFIFGTFIGKIINDLTVPLSNKKYSIYMVEIAVTAFRVQSEVNRGILWNKVQGMINRLPPFTIFSFDIFLRKQLVRNYEEITVPDFEFFNIHFSNHNIVSSVFLNCTFKNCVFDINYLNGISFIDCSFYNCSVVNGNFLDGQNEMVVIKCKQTACSILIEDSKIYQNEPSDEEERQKEILSHLWKISPSKGHHLLMLFDCFDKKNQRKIHRSLKALEEKELLRIEGHYIKFNINKINQIKGILQIK